MDCLGGQKAAENSKDQGEDGKLDSMTHRLRERNDQYTELTEEMISNIKTNPSTFFSVAKEIKFDDSRHFRPRHTYSYDQWNVRGPYNSHRFGYIGEMMDRNPEELHNSCKRQASVRWGPQKTGEATRSHFFGETVDKYTNIDMYRRPATTYPGRITMDHGRAADGYYAARNPSNTTWFGATMSLHRGFPSMRPKTVAEYQRERNAELMAREMRRSEWPEMSEYTDNFMCSSVPIPPAVQKRKAALISS